MRYKLLILVVLVIGLAAIVSAIAIGILRRDLIVEEHPYEAGLEFDKRLKKYAELGWNLETLEIKENNIVVRVTDRNNESLKGAIVECSLNKCADVHTKNYICRYKGDGYYQAAIDMEGARCIDVKVNVLYGGEVLSFDRKLNIEKQSQKGGD